MKKILLSIFFVSLFSNFIFSQELDTINIYFEKVKQLDSSNLKLYTEINYFSGNKVITPISNYETENGYILNFIDKPKLFKKNEITFEEITLKQMGSFQSLEELFRESGKISWVPIEVNITPNEKNIFVYFIPLIEWEKYNNDIVNIKEKDLSRFFMFSGTSPKTVYYNEINVEVIIKTENKNICFPYNIYKSRTNIINYSLE
jgi:hypothetical protein